MSRHRVIYSPLIVVQNIANKLAAENKGETNDSVLRIKVSQHLQANPGDFDFDRAASGLVDHWHKGIRHALNKAKGFYIPQLHIKFDKGRNVIMREMNEPQLRLWSQMDHANLELQVRTIEKKDSFRNEWRSQLVKHPECPTLGDIQREIYGFKEETDAPLPPEDPPYIPDDDGEDD